MTAADGTFEVTLAPGHATFAEEQGGGTWGQSGNTVDRTNVTGTAVAALQADLTYSVDASAGSTVDGLFFGNVCLGAGGGRGLGYWANRGNSRVTADDLAGLSALPLPNKDGSDCDPATRQALATWLLDGNSPNMSWMTSVQLASLWLAVAHGDVGGGAIVYAPGTTSGNGRGFTTVSALIGEAEALLEEYPLCLAGYADRSYMEAVKNAIEGSNGNSAFVEPGPQSCPAAVLP